MGCFNDPAWKVSGWVVGGGVADTNYLYPARWGSINSQQKYHRETNRQTDKRGAKTSITSPPLLVQLSSCKKQSNKF